MFSAHTESHLGGSTEMIEAYRHFLEAIHKDKDAWFCNPCDAATWWKKSAI